MDNTATLSELHDATGRVMHPVLTNGQELTITEHGEACAKIVPVKKLVDRTAALALLRSLGPVDLPRRP